MRKPWRSGVLLLVMTGCVPSDAAPTSQFQIEGHVVDDLSGHAVDNAIVDFSSDTLDRAETNTDHDGHFSLVVDIRDGVDFGIVSAKHADYQPSATQTLYFDGTEHQLTLRLRATVPTK